MGSLLEDLPEVAELDLNPVIVTPDGAVRMDARDQGHSLPSADLAAATPPALTNDHRRWDLRPYQAPGGGAVMKTTEQPTRRADS
ncbi:acetate--CoA ligase family protein [Nonomuraea guangzhouensis]|uniref:Acetate--CoA ligase family protein n=1 Tax=Nonomuraea guangzhouensis TaxID=1291555 RepID=A0ABW4GUQ6_9ACTN|nr:acetate--CoA ligase family protein [Nonomuraea guangzhouensis]